MPDSKGSVDLGSLTTEQQERLAQMAEENDTDPTDDTENGGTKGVPCTVAFLLVQDLEGRVMAAPANTVVDAARAPSTDDMFMLASAVVKDIGAQETAQMAAAMMMQQAQQQMEQARAAQMASQLQQSGNLRV